MGIFDIFKKKETAIDPNQPNPYIVTKSADINSADQSKLEKDLESLKSLEAKIASNQTVVVPEKLDKVQTALKIKNPFRGE